MAKPQKHRCLECGAELQVKPRGRARKYCSDECRSAFSIIAPTDAAHPRP